MPSTVRVRYLEWLIRGRSAQVIPGPIRRLLGVNTVPHPQWLDLSSNVLAVLSKGGAAWMLVAFGAGLLRVRGSRGVIRGLLPALAAATLAQYPLKALFRQSRPFSARVRQALFRPPPTVGPAFPSGDAAAIFAGAWLIGRAWPQWAAPCVIMASILASGRVASGVHRPRDIVAGAAIGFAVAEAARRATSD